uniref:Ceramide synthase 6 n=1 Tax=Amphiprion percula TaxID=161767 RepID=A0A3P8TN95_AMPPE
MAGILAWFWNERFWLPHNVTWADLKNTDEATFPQAEDLYLACPLAFCIFMIRLVFERFIARPCAMGLKIQANGPQKAQPNAILEKVFTAITKHPDEKRLEGLSKQLDWDVRTIQRWFRQRRNQEKPSTLARFCESMWRFTFYLYIFTYGVRFLKKVSVPLTVDIHYYYILELSFYLSLLFSQFTDIRRKVEQVTSRHNLMISYHVPAPCGQQSPSSYFSYVNNMARVGTLVMCLHDAADVLIEAAKMLIISLSLCCCGRILNTTLFESWEIVGPYPSWWVFNLLLILLQLLHSFWSYLIVKTACRAISKGKVGKWNPLHVSKDDRSDIESSSDEDDSPPPAQKHHSSATNGTNKNHGTNGYLTGVPYPDEH